MSGPVAGTQTNVEVQVGPGPSQGLISDARSLGALSALTDAAFHCRDYLSNLPHVFSGANAQHFVTVCQSGVLVAFCSLYPTHWLRTDARRSFLLGMCIGSVCTHPDFEGRGFARLALAAAIAHARARRADFVYLFSELSAFYGKFGFESAGTETFVACDPGESGTPGVPESHNEALLRAITDRLERTGVSKSRVYLERRPVTLLDESEKRDLWAFLCVHGARAESLLDAGEFSTMMRIPAMDVVRCLCNGVLSASFFIGKGNDFQGVVHGLAQRSEADAYWLMGRFRKAHPQCAFTVMTGPFLKMFHKDFRVTRTPSVMCLGFADQGCPTEALKTLFKRGEIYVRSLHSS